MRVDSRKTFFSCYKSDRMYIFQNAGIIFGEILLNFPQESYNITRLPLPKDYVKYVNFCLQNSIRNDN